MNNEKPSISIIGAGAAGTALAIALHRKGYPIHAVASRSEASAQRCASLVDAPRTNTDLALAAQSSEVVIIATPDGAIRQVCEQIARGNGFSGYQLVLHLSGALGAEELQSARDCGALTLSFHPIQTLSDPQKGAELLIGSYFCLEGERAAIERGQALVSDLNGTALVISDQDKALYHAALCMASNYLIVLQDMAVRMLEPTGIPREQALKALLPLIQGSVDNLLHSGLPHALTGPISRGDSQTLESHLRAMSALPKDLVALYQSLGIEAVRVAREKGNLNPADARDILILLEALNQV